MLISGARVRTMSWGSIKDSLMIFVTKPSPRMLPSGTTFRPLWRAKAVGMIRITFPSSTAVKPLISRADRKTWYASSGEILVGVMRVTLPVTRSSRMKFRLVSSLITLIRAAISMLLKFRVM